MAESAWSWNGSYCTVYCCYQAYPPSGLPQFHPSLPPNAPSPDHLPAILSLPSLLGRCKDWHQQSSACHCASIVSSCVDTNVLFGMFAKLKSLRSRPCPDAAPLWDFAGCFIVIVDNTLGYTEAFKRFCDTCESAYSWANRSWNDKE